MIMSESTHRSKQHCYEHAIHSVSCLHLSRKVSRRMQGRVMQSLVCSELGCHYCVFANLLDSAVRVGGI